MNLDSWIYWNHVKEYAKGRKGRRKSRWLKKYLRLEKRYQPNDYQPVLRFKKVDLALGVGELE